MQYIEEYFALFAGFGLLALMIGHPTVIPSLVGGLQQIFTNTIALARK